MQIKLRDWQKEAATKCLNWYTKNNDNKFVINAAPGTGKTICSISIINELKKQDQIDRVIVIAPLAYIWALNTLFPMLNLEYSFVNWVAICLLHSFFHQNITVKK